MSKLIKELSTFLPCYNEAENLGKTARNVLTNLKRVAEKYELIIVNDGSRDNTQHVAQELAAKDQNIRIINHPVNRGYGAAFKSGLYAAKYPWISFIDADGQFDFSEIDQFIKIQKETEADLVIGYYRHRQVLFVRKLNTFAWQTVVFLLFGLKVRDIDCGFKLISKRSLIPFPNSRVDAALLLAAVFDQAKKIGYKLLRFPSTITPAER